MFYNNQWGTICDDFFSVTDGNVVCEMLNFTQGALCIPSSYTSFGQGTGKVGPKFKLILRNLVSINLLSSFSLSLSLSLSQLKAQSGWIMLVVQLMMKYWKTVITMVGEFTTVTMVMMLELSADYVIIKFVNP